MEYESTWTERMLKICICNIFFPCQNELKRNSDIIQWAVLGFGSLLRSIGPIMAFIGQSKNIEFTKENYNNIWTYLPDGDGNPQMADLRLLENVISKSEYESIQLEFYYNESNPVDRVLVQDILISKSRIIISNPDDIRKNFNPEYETKILIHGWKGTTQSRSVQLIRDAYIKRGRANIFAINWSQQAGEINYIRPARFTLQVGKAIAKVIDLLVKDKSADPKRIHLIGHSLGAHAMGYAGLSTNNKVGRITGLDPASLGFDGCVGPRNRLDFTDALFVDVIHTSISFVGFKNPIGNVDFYPNGGSKQPGSGCSHSRSFELMAESINSKKGFYASLCKTLKEALDKICDGPKILMGDPVPTNASGIYYLKTADKPDYALGDNYLP